MRLHFVKGSTMFFNDALSAKKAISNILFKFKDRWTILHSAKSSDDIEGKTATLLNVKSSDDIERHKRISSPVIPRNAYAFRQWICSSKVIPRNAYAFRQGIYNVSIIRRSLDDFAFSKIER